MSGVVVSVRMMGEVLNLLVQRVCLLMLVECLASVLVGSDTPPADIAKGVKDRLKDDVGSRVRHEE